MATTNNTALLSALASANRGIIVTVTYKSEAKLLGGKSNALNGRVEKVSTAQYQFAPTYEQCVKNALGRGGFDKDSFKSEAPKGFHHLEGSNGRFVVSNKSDEIHAAMRVLHSNVKTAVAYLVDGREATAEEVAEIKATSPKSSYSVKQAACGLTTEQEQVQWRWLNLNKIVEIKGL